VSPTCHPHPFFFLSPATSPSSPATTLLHRLLSLPWPAPPALPTGGEPFTARATAKATSTGACGNNCAKGRFSAAGGASPIHRRRSVSAQFLASGASMRHHASILPLTCVGVLYCRQ
jgi:hypothetical protein